MDDDMQRVHDALRYAGMVGQQQVGRCVHLGQGGLVQDGDGLLAWWRAR
jgi:hypothetical protein